jgi:hypothetical protein
MELTAVCPKTHYDFLKLRAPGFVSQIERSFGNKGRAEVDFSFARSGELAAAELDRRVKVGYKIPELTVAPKLEQMKKWGSPPTSIADMEALAQEEWRLVRVSEGAKIADEFERAKAFNRNGRKTFYFSKNLTLMLADTELDLGCELLIPPFETCMFVYESSIFASVFSTGYPELNQGDFTTTVYLEGVKLKDGPHAVRVSAYVVTKKGIVVRRERFIPLSEGDTVSDAITGEKASDTWRHEEDAGLLFARVVANSLLYLSSSNPDISGGIRSSKEIAGRATPRQKRAMLENLTALNYTYVGGRSGTYVRNANDDPVRLVGRKKVRGHWKSQAHGPGWGERRHIHIEPYWKGDDAAELVDKAYRVR